MLSFHGIESCLADANNRIKLTPKFITDFSARGMDLVLELLPEGCLALYPEEEYLRINKAVEEAESNPASFLTRQKRRQSGGWSISTRITPQGRIVIPAEFGERVNILPGKKVRLVGIKIGVEIWNAEAFEEEQKCFMDFSIKKRQTEMEQGLKEV